MSYNPVETCIKTDSPSPPCETTCRQNLGSDLSAKEHPCIFPFYYQGTSRHCCNLATAQETCNPELEDGSRVPQLTCIWMSLPGASGLGNLTNSYSLKAAIG